MNIIKRKAIKYGLLLFIFFLGSLLGVLCWDKIVLPFYNPWGVIGLLAELQFNPLNNIVRFIILISFPTLLLAIICLFSKGRVNNYLFYKKRSVAENLEDCPIIKSGSNRLVLLFYIVYSIILAINIIDPGDFDSFHEGETLGTSVSYLSGETPYKDFVFCHGVYQDPLRSVVAFNILGKSIGSVRTLESITRIFSLILLSLLILKFFRGNYFFSFSFILILVLINTGFYLHVILPKFPESLTIINYARDITLYGFIITISVIYSFITQRDHSITKFSVAAFFFSFIPIAAFGYSIDRGLYLFASYLILSPMFYFLFFRKSVFKGIYLMGSLFGVLFAIILLLLMLRGNFLDFFQYTFLIMPKYKELLDGLIYPIYYKKFLLICILIALNTFWVSYKFFQEYHHNNYKPFIAFTEFFRKYLLEFSILLLSVFFFRTALGRSDWSHNLYSNHLTYILSILILFKHYLYQYCLSKKLHIILIFIVLISSSFFVLRIYRSDLIAKVFPMHIEDSEFIPSNYKSTISFLKENLANDESFITMTSEASWYYFIDKPCPTRFPVVWFAAPSFFQEEVNKDLKMKNVKYILYKNNLWSNKIDGFDIEKRFPIINSFLKQNYVFLKTIDDNEIWISKRYAQ